MRRKRASWLGVLALAGAFSCSVFPDEATLPAGAAAGAPGAGGSSVLPHAGMAGAAAVEAHGGAGAGSDEAGAPSGGTPGGAPTGMGGSPDPLGGAAGASGSAACTSSQLIVGETMSDTWIESAKPKATHGNEKLLSVVAGGQQRRALLQVALPVLPVGAVLLRATLSLHLESNADVDLLARQLTVHLLAHEVFEGRATWEKWSNGNNDWMTPGGDFGAAVAETTVPAGGASAALSLDVTQSVLDGIAANATSLPFIVLEKSSPPPAPADLAFTSRQGDASGVPALIVEYCEP